MQREVLILGKGPSFDFIDLDDWSDCDWAVISSTAGLMTRRYAMWFGVDPRGLFDERTARLVEQYADAIHVAATASDWQGARVVRWPMLNHREPRDGAVVTGRLAERAWGGLETFVEHHSLLFAVQVLYLLGYTRLVFGGCDMLDQHSAVVVAALREWYDMRPAGVDWFNLSSLSYLTDFLPKYPRRTVTI